MSFVVIGLAIGATVTVVGGFIVASVCASRVARDIFDIFDE